MYNQLFDDIGTFFSLALLDGSQKGYNTQHVLLIFLQKNKASLDNKELAGALMDLSKACDCIYHNLGVTNGEY